MTSDSTKNAAPTNGKADDEQDEPSVPGQRGEQAPQKTTGEHEDDVPDTEGPNASEDDGHLGASEEVDDSVSDTPTEVTSSSGGFVAGAAAVVSAGLGLVSLTGTGLGDMLHAREEIIGQIKVGAAGRAGGVDQVEALYGAPWHTAALANGLFALVAVLIGVVLLAGYSGRTDTRPWVRSVALGGSVLGAVGVLLAIGMYFDIFAAQPALSSAPLPGTGG